MKPQIRTYILIVGRDRHDRPVRRLAPYRVPISGWTDGFEQLSNNRLRLLETSLSAEKARIDMALEDILVEKTTRLERI